MKSSDKIEQEDQRKIHYYIVGGNFKKILKKLDKELHYYRILFDSNIVGSEVIYDVPNNLLTGAGIILSKQFQDGKLFFKVRKISQLPGGYKRPSQKFTLGESEVGEHPKDFPMQIANAISNAFANVFTIDLVSVVRQTVPKIQIDVKAKKYNVFGGTGYRCSFLCENAIYRDLETNKKVKRPGFTVNIPIDEKYEKENKIILAAIEHGCKELVGYEQSRFEIAERLLHPKPYVDTKTEESAEENKE